MLMLPDTSEATATGFDMDYLSLNTLYDAFQLSKKGSSWKGSVQKYECELLRNLLETRHELLTGSYQQKPFWEFELNERGKQRHIKSLHISDRVVQRSFCDNVLIPATQKKLIYDNGASIKGKGISFARKRIVVHLRRFYEEYGSEGYILQIDFKKFFDSIPHDKLKAQFKPLLNERDYTLFSDLIDTFEGGKGLGIGSQISQVSGVYYPTPIDNYFKIVKGCKYYGRYMDDTYIIHQDKEYLKELLKDYIWLAEKWGLAVNLKKTQIIKLSHGFTFLKTKYNLLRDGTILRRLSRDNITRERRRLKKFYGMMPVENVAQAYASWRGTYKKFNSHTTIREMDKVYNNLYGGIYYEREFKSGENRRNQSTACTAKMRPRRQNGGISNWRLEDS